MALVNPHGGGSLRPLLLEGQTLKDEVAKAQSLPKVKLSSRENGDVIMMGIGGFTPLTGFMTHSDWQGVCDGMKMANGLFWPIPVTLSTDDESVVAGNDIALVDGESGEIMATMKVTEKYGIDKAHECMQVYERRGAAANPRGGRPSKRVRANTIWRARSRFCQLVASRKNTANSS